MMGPSELEQETQLSLTNRATRLARSVKVTKHGTISYVRYGFLLVFYSNFVRKTHRFCDVRLQRCLDLENRSVKVTENVTIR